jgi:hypothetical protein
MAQNDFRIVGAGTTYLSPTDFLIQVDTSAGAVTIILPKIATIFASYTTIFQYMGIRVVDVSDNASVNNITIQAFETNVVNNSQSVILNTNGAGGIFTLIGNNEWSYNANSTSGGGGGANTPIDVTYAQLYANIQNSELIAGQNYRLTDYQSTNILNGSVQARQYLNGNITPTDPNYNPVELYTSPTIENLVFQAISSNEINPQVVSQEFPYDVILYLPSVNTIISQIDIYNGATLNLNSGTLNVSGFDLQFNGTNCYITLPTETPVVFGYFVQINMDFNPTDNLNEQFLNPQPNITLTPNISDGSIPSNIDISSDGLTITFLDLTATDYANYVVDSLVVVIGYVIGNQKGLITSRKFVIGENLETNLNIDCDFDWRSQKYRRFEIDLSAINSNLGLGKYGIGDNPNILGTNYPTTGNYIDAYTISNKYEKYAFNVVIKGNYLLYVDNNVFRTNPQNVFLNGCRNNSIGSATNVSFNFCDDNIIDSIENITTELINFNSNVVWSISRCQINEKFDSNNLLDIISDCVIDYNCNNNLFNTMSNVSLPTETNNNIFNGYYNDCIITRYCENNNFQNGSIFNNNKFTDLVNNVPTKPIDWQNNNGFGLIDDVDVTEMSANNITGILTELVGENFDNNIVTYEVSSITFSQIIENNFYALFNLNTLVLMTRNTFNSQIDNCIFATNFQKNIFNDNTSGIDYSLATHIYQTYLCSIFLGSDFDTYLQYFDGTNMQYVSPNS